MGKIKSIALATLMLAGCTLPAAAQIGEPRSNFSVGVNGGVNLNSTSFTPTIKQNSLLGTTGGLTARFISEKYFAMICGAQVELNFSQRGWDQLFETVTMNDKGYEETVKDDLQRYSVSGPLGFRKGTGIAVLHPCGSANQLPHQRIGNHKGD